MQKISAGKFHFEPPFTSFDHLVGTGEHSVRYRQAERLGGLEVDHKLIFGRCLYRKVCRFLALEDAIDVAGRAPMLIQPIRRVGDQAAVNGGGEICVNGGQLELGGELYDQMTMNHRRCPCYDQTAVRSAREGRDPVLDLVGVPRIDGLTCTPSEGARAWMALNWAGPVGMAGSRRTATCATPGASSLSSSSHFPLMLYSYSMKPVALPPGRAKLSTKPAPTGSATSANTTGTG